MIKLRRINEVYTKLDCEPGILYEIAAKFSFFVPNYFFMPAYKAGAWDGTISMVDRRSGLTYWGLSNEIVTFCQEQGYPIEWDSELSHCDTVSDADTLEAIKTLKVPQDKIPRDYQVDSVTLGLRHKKTVILSPTASGKSLSIYVLAQALKAQGKKVLIIVPNLGLIDQLHEDFTEYAKDNPDIDVAAETHKIFGGQDKETKKPIVIATWQSLQYMRKPYFNQYTSLICDEVHGADAKQLTGIIENMSESTHRIGFTGTLKSDTISKTQITALFGTAHQVVTTKELVDRGILAKAKIRIIILTYPPEISKVIRSLPYKDQIDYLVTCEARNEFIAKLAVNSKGNTMTLFRLVKKHGKPLHTLTQTLAADKKKCYFVSGEVEAEMRTAIRKLTEQGDNAIINASFKCFGTGTNIVNLNNLILGHPSKARVALLQAIGRALRTGERKSTALIVDIVDNFPSVEKTRKGNDKGKNYAEKHFQNRLDIYTQEGFDVEFVEVPLKLKQPQIDL